MIFKGIRHNFKVTFTAKEKERINFCRIRSRRFLEPRNYPVLTMFFQAVASVFVCLECMFAFVPDVYCDTIGAAFTYPVVKMICRCPIIAYVHYPMISTDMFRSVREKSPIYTIMNGIASHHTISYFKNLYYQIFAFAYGLAGRCADDVMVNSTWTRKHIENLWTRRLINSRLVSQVDMSKKLCIQTLYPPCNVSALIKIPIRRRYRIILSVGQFRLEKNHSLQLRVFKALYERDPNKYENVYLMIVGSCRNHEDELQVKALELEAAEVGIPKKNVVFKMNVPFSDLRRFYALAAIGIHTMWNEHFGISIVEMMAAGLVVVAHNSGGPKDDIINISKQSRTGYLASNSQEYADIIEDLLEKLDLREVPEGIKMHHSDGLKFFDVSYSDDADRNLVSTTQSPSRLAATSERKLASRIAERARISTERFSDELFSSKVITVFSKYF